MSEIDWSRLKASEIKALAARNAIVIVPIGATEQHGPHLPSMVDWRCVHEVSHRAARIMEKTTPTVVTPTIPFGMSEHHMSLNGTITLDYATMYAVIRCVVTSSRIRWPGRNRFAVARRRIRYSTIASRSRSRGWSKPSR